MDPIAILNELISFAGDNYGLDIKSVVRSFVKKNPRMVRPADEDAPPTRNDQAIDDEIDELIESGDIGYRS